MKKTRVLGLVLDSNQRIVASNYVHGASGIWRVECSAESVVVEASRVNEPSYFVTAVVVSSGPLRCQGRLFLGSLERTITMKRTERPYMNKFKVVRD